jgi:hypothetical protein
MEKKPAKPLKTLRLRKEALRSLTSNQLVRVHAGVNLDPWDLPTNTCGCTITLA